MKTKKEANLHIYLKLPRGMSMYYEKLRKHGVTSANELSRSFAIVFMRSNRLGDYDGSYCTRGLLSDSSAAKFTCVSFESEMRKTSSLLMST